MGAAAILLIIALICWFVAAVWQTSWPSPVQLGWLGLFFYGLHVLVGR